MAGPEELWEEITDGWNGREEYDEVEGKRKKKKQDYKPTSNRKHEVAKRTQRGAFLYLGDALFYNFWQLEGHRKEFACCGRHFPTGNFTEIFLVKCVFISNDCVSPSFSVDRLRFFISTLVLGYQTPNSDQAGTFLPIPRAIFPATNRGQDDEDRLIPPARKQSIIDSALTIPKWMDTMDLSTINIHPNFLR